MGAALEGLLGPTSLPVRSGEDNDIAARKLGRRPLAPAGGGPQRPRHRVGPSRAPADHHQLVEPGEVEELSSGARANRACTHDNGPHASGYRRSGPESSRQPPPCGGTPPDPRRRITPAANAATATASAARRS